MFTGCTTPSYTTQESTSSNDSEIFSQSSCNVIQYGPITVRLSRKAAPRLETGRRSKHLILVGDEAIKREKRRQKNREAARKLKIKRQLIEVELHQRLKDLEHQYSSLQNYLQQLRQKREYLQNEVNNLITDPIDDLLLNDNRDIPSFLQQYSNDFDLFDEPIDHILNYD
jgi:hypothetical protein